MFNINNMAFEPRFDAVIFDLDGVITKTALVHASSWKKMFDEYMLSREERFGEAFREFTHAGDYLPYLFGSNSYVLVRRARELPQKLPMLYARLTAS